jgi:aminoglycoside phosphotransferase (APT) family kinase protein
VPDLVTDLLPEQLTALRRFLAACGEDVNGDLRSELMLGGRSNLTYRLTDGRSVWVLRRPPTGGLTQSAHDVAREFRVGRALQGTAVPVARTVAFEDSSEMVGAPFTVVEFVPGRSVRSSEDLVGWSEQDVAACSAGLVDALVALHAVDFRDVGLARFGRTEGYAARQLARWSRQWRELNAEDLRADRLLRLLESGVPDQSSCSVVHGDYRVDNTILDSTEPGVVRAIVDWEMSTLGDPVADVALMCAYRHPALNGVLGVQAAWTSDRFPSPDELRGMYEERSGASLDHWDFYLALAFYKLAVISAGIAHRHGLGATSGDGFEDVAQMVPEFLEAGLEVVSNRV